MPAMNKPEEKKPVQVPEEFAATFGGFPEETVCASCGKFVGAYPRCPYCGEKHERRMSIRFFRFFALAFSLGGVFLIWLAARGINAPLIKIKDIGPTHNFAYVRIEGENTRSRIYDDGSVAFYVDDGTETMMVRAYREVGRQLVEEGRLPGAGDRVSVEGTLNLREEFVMMIVNVPEKVRVVRVEPESTAIVNIDDSYLDHKVLMEGKIVATRKFNKGGSLTLHDGTGSLEVVIWDSNRKAFGEKERLLEEGRNVRLSGKVGKYRDKMQISLDFPGDIQELERDVKLPESVSISSPGTRRNVEKMDIGAIGRDRLNQWVEITGKVEDLRKFSVGRGLKLVDPTGSVEVVVWDSIAAQIPAADRLFQVGSFLRVEGVVGEYQNQLQVVPKSSNQIGPAQQ